MRVILVLALAAMLGGCETMATADQRIGCINSPQCSGQLDPVSQTGQGFPPH